MAALTDPLGNTTTISTDAAGNPRAATDALGNTTYNHYDGNGYLAQSVDADGHVMSFAHDADGNLLTQTEADGGGWSVTYNADDRPTSVGLIGLPRTVQYDAANQVTQATEPNGQSTTLWLRRARRLVPGHAARRDCCRNQHLRRRREPVAVTDSLGNVTRYDYDADKRLIQTTYPDGSTEKRTTIWRAV